MEDQNDYYESRLDKIFDDGPNWKHRTFRTILDPYSSEWNSTDMEEKIKILQKIIASGESLERLIIEYKRRYDEKNRRDISSVVDEALITLLQYSLKNRA